MHSRLQVLSNGDLERLSLANASPPYRYGMVIQSQQFQYQWKAYTQVTISELDLILHRFQHTMDYQSNFHCRQQVSFNTFVMGEPLNSGLQTITSTN